MRFKFEPHFAGVSRMLREVEKRRCAVVVLPCAWDLEMFCACVLWALCGCCVNAASQPREPADTLELLSNLSILLGLLKETSKVSGTDYRPKASSSS